MRTVVKILIIFLISMLIGNMAYGMYQEMSLSDTPSFQNAGSEQNSIQETEEKDNSKQEIGNTDSHDSQQKQWDNWEKIPQEYQGYPVSAKLSIPTIALETYVFSEYDEKAMWICPTKYYGPEPNEIGNFCIAAHNYEKENMFNHIIELKKGDNIYLTDNTNGKVTYQVTDIYKVKPNNTAPLSQETGQKTCLTLITCSDYSSKRIIVRAEKN